MMLDELREIAKDIYDEDYWEEHIIPVVTYVDNTQVKPTYFGCGTKV